ncbi:MAG: hypothetical protein PHQ98_00350 [Candidatus ainarchaeum sp.]|nr:hypothetical protein [Candidatus ainarchaeum sp.]
MGISWVNLNKKGQASLEFILIMFVVLLFIYSVTFPNSVKARSAVTDISQISTMDNEMLKLVNSINRVSLLSTGSAEKINLAIPNDTNFICFIVGNQSVSDIIGFSSKINQDVSFNGSKTINPNSKLVLCPNNVCDKNYVANVYSDLILDCSGLAENVKSGYSQFMISKTGLKTIQIN